MFLMNAMCHNHPTRCARMLYAASLLNARIQQLQKEEKLTLEALEKTHIIFGAKIEY